METDETGDFEVTTLKRSRESGEGVDGPDAKLKKVNGDGGSELQENGVEEHYNAEAGGEWVGEGEEATWVPSGEGREQNGEQVLNLCFYHNLAFLPYPCTLHSLVYSGYSWHRLLT
jgi:hypothetical protein